VTVKAIESTNELIFSTANAQSRAVIGWSVSIVLFVYERSESDLVFRRKSTTCCWTLCRYVSRSWIVGVPIRKPIGLADHIVQWETKSRVYFGAIDHDILAVNPELPMDLGCMHQSRYRSSCSRRCENSFLSLQATLSLINVALVWSMLTLSKRKATERSWPPSLLHMLKDLKARIMLL